MGKFIIKLTDKAKKDLAKHKKSGNKSLNTKIVNVLKELQDHPFSGTGKPEQLKHDLANYWSRRLNQKHRIIYSVSKKKTTVEVVSALGHYFDK